MGGVTTPCQTCGRNIAEGETQCWMCKDPVRAQEARLRGAETAGRKFSYESLAKKLDLPKLLSQAKVTPEPLGSLEEILGGLGELIAVLKGQPMSSAVANNLIAAYRTAADLRINGIDRPAIEEKIADLQKRLGVLDEQA